VKVSDVSEVNHSPSSGKDGGWVSFETSENLHVLTLLSARENFIEFCRREIFKMYSLQGFIIN